MPLYREAATQAVGARRGKHGTWIVLTVPRFPLTVELLRLAEAKEMAYHAVVVLHIPLVVHVFGAVDWRIHAGRLSLSFPNGIDFAQPYHPP